MKSLYAYLQILSLDVVIGAWGSGLMVATLLDVEMPLVWHWVLPLSVWVIYTADHLMDAWRLKSNAHTPRHLFHYRNFKWIFSLWLIAFLLCLIYVPWIVPPAIRTFGFLMGGMVLAHLSLVALIGDRISWFLHKELGVGSIYTAGVWGGAMCVMGFPFPLPVWLNLVQFFLLALINLLVFSMYEREIDEMDGHTSFVRAIGKNNTLRLVVGMGISCVILGVTSLLHGQALAMMGWVQAVFLLMLMILLWIAFAEERFGPTERYRAWGDFVFILPIIVPLIHFGL